MVPSVFLERVIADNTPFKFPPINVISDDSIAISVPVPMAMAGPALG